jgi:hypothetical protein
MPKSGHHMSSRATRTALQILAAAGLAVLLQSCFGTRDSIPPTAGGDLPDPALTPDVVLSNLILAVNVQNAQFYEQNFAPNFIFRPDPSDSVEVEKDYPGVYGNWNRDIETGVTEYMLDPVRCKFANLQFGNEIIVEETDSTSVLQEDYVLIVAYESVVGYSGSARLFMRRLPGGYWYIEKWIDYLNVGQDPSWGRLKGETRARM